MISADLKINGKVIVSISAANKGKVPGRKDTKNSQWRIYELDCGCLLQHDRKKGALCMLIQMAGHAELCSNRRKV